MKDVSIVKNGSKWSIITDNGDFLFTGKTRVSCFKYAHANGWNIKEYQHGGK